MRLPGSEELISPHRGRYRGHALALVRLFARPWAEARARGDALASEFKIWCDDDGTMVVKQECRSATDRGCAERRRCGGRQATASRRADGWTAPSPRSGTTALAAEQVSAAQPFVHLLVANSGGRRRSARLFARRSAIETGLVADLAADGARITARAVARAVRLAPT